MRQQSDSLGSSRDKIIAAAFELFVESGYDRTSIAAIARKAELAQGLLYRYFTGKEEILFEIIKQNIIEFQQASDVSTSAQPHEKLEEYLDNVVQAIQSNRKFWVMFYGLKGQPFLEHLMGRELLEMQKETIATLATFFDPRDAEAQKTEAILLFSIVDGICSHYALSPEGSYPIEDVKECVVNKYR